MLEEYLEKIVMVFAKTEETITKVKKQEKTLDKSVFLCYNVITGANSAPCAAFANRAISR